MQSPPNISTDARRNRSKIPGYLPIVSQPLQSLRIIAISISLALRVSFCIRLLAGCLMTKTTDGAGTDVVPPPGSSDRLEAAVEAGARAFHDAARDKGSLRWEAASEKWRQELRDLVRPVVVAALKVNAS
jgi:hypothetical protein